VGLELNETHQLLSYADDVRLLGGNTNTTKKNTEAITGPGKNSAMKNIYSVAPAYSTAVTAGEFVLCK
jgi:hypothetical protein